MFSQPLKYSWPPGGAFKHCTTAQPMVVLCIGGCVNCRFRAWLVLTHPRLTHFSKTLPSALVIITDCERFFSTSPEIWFSPEPHEASWGGGAKGSGQSAHSRLRGGKRGSVASFVRLTSFFFISESVECLVKSSLIPTPVDDLTHVNVKQFVFYQCCSRGRHSCVKGLIPVQLHWWWNYVFIYSHGSEWKQRLFLTPWGCFFVGQLASNTWFLFFFFFNLLKHML